MPTSYTSLIGLAKPANGELAGTWGTVVNDYLTEYVDAAVAGAQVISGSQTAVTLSKTEGASLVQAGAGATGSSQYQVIRCTGNPASALTITAPATNKTYVVINATSTSQSVTIRGAGPTTGVSIPSATQALVSWNGSDFVIVASNRITTLTGTLATANGGTGLTSFTTNGAVYATSTSALTTGTLPVASGGTGATTTQAAINALAGAVTSGQYLRGNGTNVVMSAIQAADVPTLNQNTTGTASNVSGTVAIANGGTGATTASAAATALGVGTASSTQLGSLGVGTAASGTTGEIRATNNVTAYYSDDRLKVRLGNIRDAVQKVERLNGFHYHANEVAQSLGYEVKEEVGVSAQEVQAVMPEVVAEAPISSEYLTVRYERLVPLLIEAVKELSARVKELEAR